MMSKVSSRNILKLKEGRQFMSSTFSPQPANGPKPRKRILNPLLWLPLLAIMLIAGTLSLYLRDYVQAAPSVSFVQIPGSVPGIVAHSKMVGPANTNQTISLAVSLNLRNQNALNTYLSEVTQPKSTIYHRYLSPAAFIGAFSPTQAAYEAVTSYLRQAGFTITQTYNHRLLVVFSGTVGLAERIFNVQINNYMTAKDQAFYSNTTNPVLPSTIASNVQTITGLNNVTRFQRDSVLSSMATKQMTTVKTPDATCTGSGFPYYVPSQIASAYNISGFYSNKYYGEGQSIGLFEFAQFQAGDISAYRNCYDQKSPTSIQTIAVDGGAPTPGNNDNGGAAEAELDIELAMSAAPHLGQIRVYEAPNNAVGDEAQWGKILQDAVPVVSTSWTRCEAGAYTPMIEAEYSLFEAMAAQGQTILSASSDTGSEGCLYDPTYPSTALAVDDPASQPYVTGVGGTTLTLNGSSYGSEVAWNDQPTHSNNPHGGATGGGISDVWQMLNYQSNSGVPGVINSYSSSTPCNAPSGKYCREVPDVALHSSDSNYYLVYCTVAGDGCPSSGWVGAAGTSCAAPIWAAIIALTNEESVRNGGFNIGFVNPSLYQIAAGSHYSQDFHDITSGDNDFNYLHNGAYPATADYDMTTGLGSPNAYNLAQDLIALGSQRATTPANTLWYFAEGSVGGGFQEYLTLQNPGTQTANVTVQYLEQGHGTVTKTYGVGASTRYTVNVNGSLGISPSMGHVSVAAIVSSTEPIVAERPMYFDFNGISSGTDVVGATNPQTSYYFPYGNQTQSGSTHDWTYVTMLNPSSTQTAHVTITYYTGSCTSSCPTESVTMQPLTRATASPGYVGLSGPVAIAVSSDQPIVAERPMYVNANVPNSGQTAGAASEVGATSGGTNWLFAEGFTGSGFQEYLNLTNFGANAATATINLEFTNGDVMTQQVPVPVGGLVQFNVNTANGTCNPSPCTPTTAVSAQVTSDQPIVVDRLQYFHYGNSGIPGITEAVGAAAAQNVYSFAEGYTGGQFTEYLTLQNPTSNAETVAVTLFAQSGLVFQLQVNVAAHSRGTLTINNILNPMGAGSVSLVAQVVGNGKIVAERPEYFNYSINGTNIHALGGTDVIGYTGG
jgi:hypothetical protein